MGEFKMNDNKLTSKVLKSGTVIKLYGIPFSLENDTSVIGTEKNFDLLEILESED
jgi:hypothetical protein